MTKKSRQSQKASKSDVIGITKLDKTSVSTGKSSLTKAEQVYWMSLYKSTIEMHCVSPLLTGTPLIFMVDLLSSWLELKDFSRLEQSLLNWQFLHSAKWDEIDHYRKEALTSAAIVLNFKTLRQRESSLQMLQWMYKRGYTINHLTIENLEDKTIDFEYMRENLITVENITEIIISYSFCEIKCSASNCSQLGCFLNSCPNLSKLSFICCDNLSASFFKYQLCGDDRLTNLMCLTIRYCPSSVLHNDALDWLKCSRLVRFTLVVYKPPEWYSGREKQIDVTNSIMSIVERNPYLECVTIDGWLSYDFDVIVAGIAAQNNAAMKRFTAGKKMFLFS